jgi:hypothetical protein
MPETSCLDPTCKVSSHPMDEDGHSRRFQGERQGAEDGGRKSLAEEFHSLGRYFTLGPDHSCFGNRRVASIKGQDDCECDPARVFIHLPGTPSERRRLLVDQRHLYQLHVDRETQPPVELIEQRGFPA